MISALSPQVRRQIQSYKPEFKFFDDDQKRYVLIGHGNTHSRIENENIWAYIKPCKDASRRLCCLRRDSGKVFKISQVYTGPSRTDFLRLWHIINPIIPSECFPRSDPQATRAFKEVMEKVLEDGVGGGIFDVSDLIRGLSQTTNCIEPKKLRRLERVEIPRKVRKQTITEGSPRERAQEVGNQSEIGVSQQSSRRRHKTYLRCVQNLQRTVDNGNRPPLRLESTRWGRGRTGSCDELGSENPTPNITQLGLATTDAVSEPMNQYLEGNHDGAASFAAFFQALAAQKHCEAKLLELHNLIESCVAKAKELQDEEKCDRTTLLLLVHDTVNAFNGVAAGISTKV